MLQKLRPLNHLELLQLLDTTWDKFQVAKKCSKSSRFKIPKSRQWKVKGNQWVCLSTGSRLPAALIIILPFTHLFSALTSCKDYREQSYNHICQLLQSLWVHSSRANALVNVQFAQVLFHQKYTFFSPAIQRGLWNLAFLKASLAGEDWGKVGIQYFRLFTTPGN